MTRTQSQEMDEKPREDRVVNTLIPPENGQTTGGIVITNSSKSTSTGVVPTEATVSARTAHEEMLEKDTKVNSSSSNNNNNNNGSITELGDNGMQEAIMLSKDQLIQQLAHHPPSPQFLSSSDAMGARPPTIHERTLSQQSDAQTDNSGPGAYAIAPAGFTSSSTMTTTMTRPQEVTQEQRVVHHDSNMPVANQVNEEENLDLPVADLEIGRGQTRKESPSRSPVAAVLYMCCLAGVIIVIAVVVRSSSGSKNEGNHPTVAPTGSTIPGQPNSTTGNNLSSAELLILESFPNTTLQALEDEESPQFLAKQWILQDLEANNNNNYYYYYNNTTRFKQRFALATIFYAMNGLEWFENKKWLNHSVHECFWFSQEEFLDLYDPNHLTYIEVIDPNPCEVPLEKFNSSNKAFEEEYGPYKHLWLHSNGLQGSMPLELFWLTSLRSISMYNNDGLTGSVPSHIGELTKLEALNFGGTMLSGTLPTELGRLSDSMLSIAIVNAQLEGSLPSELGVLTRMRHVIIDQNSLTGTIPDELADALNLEVLWLSANRLAGTVPESILHLPLEHLALYLNQFSGSIPTEIGLLSDVKQVMLFSNKFTGTIPTEVGQLSSVDYLDVDTNYLTGRLPTEIGLMEKLNDFWSSDNSLTGMIPSEVGLCSNLLWILLGPSLLTGTIPSELEQVLSLSRVGLEESLLSGSLPGGLSSDLEWLDVENITLLTGTIPATLTNLNWVYMSGTQISGTLPDYFCGVEELFFDCSLILCGCTCMCSNETNIGHVQNHTNSLDSATMWTNTFNNTA